MQRSTPSLMCAVAVVLVLSAGQVAAGSDGLSRPGTIQHALSLPEGSSVCLDAVIVDSVSADSFVVHEWWDAGTRISVKLAPPAVLAVRQTVDVEGATGMGPAILKPRVLGYLDRNGNLLLDPPVVKTPVAPVSWPWKADLTTNGKALLAYNKDEETLPAAQEALRWVADNLGMFWD